MRTKVDERFLHEESLRMPMVLSCPRRVPAGRVHDGTVTNVDVDVNVDVAQTLLDAAGVAHHARMQRVQAGVGDVPHPSQPVPGGLVGAGDVGVVRRGTPLPGDRGA